MDDALDRRAPYRPPFGTLIDAQGRVTSSRWSGYGGGSVRVRLSFKGAVRSSCAEEVEGCTTTAQENTGPCPRASREGPSIGFARSTARGHRACRVAGWPKRQNDENAAGEEGEAAREKGEATGQVVQEARTSTPGPGEAQARSRAVRQPATHSTQGEILIAPDRRLGPARRLASTLPRPVIHSPS